MTWQKVCAADDIANNTLQRFEVDGVAIVVANYGDGFQAIAPYCPHMEEPLHESGILETSGILTCSKHLWQWDIRTGEMVGMAEKSLLCYEIKVEAGDVLINIEKELVYEYDEEDELDDDDFFN